jgi:hypothetical protein
MIREDARGGADPTGLHVLAASIVAEAIDSTRYRLMGS